jgi:hypothetical protein
MSAVLKYVPIERREITQSEFSPEAICFLNKLRWKSMACRTSAYVDIFEACRLLIQDDEAMADQFADALLRTMRQGLKKAPVFYAINTKEQSFDETWLLRALFRAKKKDYASVRFLVNSRIAQPYRRSMMFLIQSVSDQISQI